MNIAVASFYMSNINEQVMEHQKRVMETLCPDIPFYQESTYFHHGPTMDLFLFQRTEDVIVFLDIDAVPLTPGAITTIAKMAYDNNTIAGAPQRANHINNGQHIYVGPCVLAIQPDLYRALKCPPARETTRGDVAEEWTYTLELSGRVPQYLDVIDYDKDSHAWDLRDGKKFGLNTFYGLDGERMFYHAFQGRDPRQQTSFITLCKTLL